MSGAGFNSLLAGIYDKSATLLVMLMQPLQIASRRVTHVVILQQPALTLQLAREKQRIPPGRQYTRRLPTTCGDTSMQRELLRTSTTNLGCT